MTPTGDVPRDEFVARWVRAIERAAFHDGRSFLFGIEPLSDKGVKYVLHDADGKIRIVLRPRNRGGLNSARWGKIGAEEARAVIVDFLTSILAREPGGGLSPGTLAFARERIRHAMHAFRELTHFGFGVYDGTPPSERAAHFRIDRAEMLSDEACAGFVTACEWLFRQAKTEHLNRQCGSSYGLKHDAERWANQNTGIFQSISNGMFIAAAIACGFRVARIRSGPNARLNISSRRNTETPKR